MKAAKLDAPGNGVYVGMDELEDESMLTESHLPQITECDLLVGEYRWVADDRRNVDGATLNPYGGSFWPRGWLKRVGKDSPSVTVEELEILRRH